MTEDPTALLHELTAEALARGERLEELSVTRPSLEDVYLELTGGRTRDAARRALVGRGAGASTGSSAGCSGATRARRSSASCCRSACSRSSAPSSPASDEDLDVIVPGIAGMSVMSATFTSLAYNLTTLRERGILKRLRGTPLPTSAYLAGLAGNAVANAALQLAIVIVAGHLLLGVTWPQDWVALGGVRRAPASICFALLGVALAHAIPNPESAPAYVNAVFLPQILIAGVFYDATDAPQVIRDIAQVLPLTHLVEGLSGAMVDGEGVGANAVSLLILGLWGLAGAILAVRGFSWEARRGQ